MADDRPVIKQDLDDLKSHIDARFLEQSMARGELHNKINKMAQTDVAHGKDIEALNKRVDNFLKGLTTLAIGVALALCKAALDFFKGG